jgi:LuxR family maltose regulon positive regulatory protein
MGELLRLAAARGIAVAYVSRLLTALEGEEGPSEPAPPPAASGLVPLVEPLSDRELEVLRLLGTSLSTSEIGDELFISVNTVRSHVKSIYGKLNVHRRYEAVGRARELGLF